MTNEPVEISEKSKQILAEIAELMGRSNLYDRMKDEKNNPVITENYSKCIADCEQLGLACRCKYD